MKLELPIEEIIQKYKDGKSLRDLGKEYSVSYDTISQRLKDNNIKRKKVGNKVIHHVNHNAFDEINPRTARVLGLIVTDGNILKRSSHRIRFTNKDLELCEFVLENKNVL